jgi:hypothetical protein
VVGKKRTIGTILGSFPAQNRVILSLPKCFERIEKKCKIAQILSTKIFNFLVKVWDKVWLLGLFLKRFLTFKTDFMMILDKRFSNKEKSKL